MLEFACAPPNKPAANQASAPAVRPAFREGGGFQGWLREAVDTPSGREQVQPTAAPDKREDGQDQIPGEAQGVAAAQDASLSGRAQPDTLGDAVKAAALVGRQAEPDAASDALLIEGAGVLPEVIEMAGPKALAQVELSLGFGELLTADGVLASQSLGVQLAPPLEPYPDGMQLSCATVLSSGHASLVGTPVMAAAEVSVAPIGIPPDAPSPAVAPSDVAMRQALSPSALQAAVQVLTAADGQPAVTPTVPLLGQALAPGSTPPGSSGQQQGPGNVLTAGLAQAVAARAEAKPHAAGGLAKPAPITPTQEAQEGTKPFGALALLTQALNNTEAAAEVKLVMAVEPVEAGARLVGLEGPKSWGESRVEGPAMAPHGFTPADGVLQRNEAPAFSAGARDMAPPPAARQLAPVVVSLALGRGDEALTIALDPVELGRVEVSIGQGKEAGQVRIVAERPETLALLQRDQRELDRALNQAGLGDMARSLSFSLASDQGRQQQQGSAHERGHPAPGIIGGLDHDRAMPVLPTPTRAATSLIDIAV